MGIFGLLAKVVSIQPSPKTLVIVAFEDFIFNIDIEALVQVIKYHSCEQASDTGSDDADLKRLGAILFPREAVYNGGKLVAALWRWLCQVSVDVVCDTLGLIPEPRFLAGSL